VGARTDPPFGQPNQDTLVGAEQAHNSLGYTLLFVLLPVQQAILWEMAVSAADAPSRSMVVELGCC